MKVEAWTDGACSGNPGPGGWGVILVAYANGKRYEKELSGGNPATTNNEMELMAVREALNALRGTGHDVTIYTDSQLVHGYLMRSWKCKASHLNRLLGEICGLRDLNGYKLEIVKVPGHSGEPLNERADALATGAIPR